MYFIGNLFGFDSRYIDHSPHVGQEQHEVLYKMDPVAFTRTFRLFSWQFMGGVSMYN